MKLQISLVVVAFIMHDLRSYPADRDESENDENTDDTVTGSALLRHIDMVHDIDKTNAAPEDSDSTTSTDTIALEKDAKTLQASRAKSLQTSRAKALLESLRRIKREYIQAPTQVDPEGGKKMDPSGTKALEDDVGKLKTQVQQLEAERAVDHETLKALDKKVDTLDQKVSELVDTVTNPKGRAASDTNVHMPESMAPTDKSATASSGDPGLAKYEKMRRARLPQAVVETKMCADGVDPTLLFPDARPCPKISLNLNDDIKNHLKKPKPKSHKVQQLEKTGPEPAEVQKTEGTLLGQLKEKLRGGGGGGGAGQLSARKAGGGGGFRDIMRRNREAAAKKAAEDGAAAPAHRPVPPRSQARPAGAQARAAPAHRPVPARDPEQRRKTYCCNGMLTVAMCGDLVPGSAECKETKG